MGVLDGKTALVSGGSRGIGRAIVRRLARDGASVVFSYYENEAAAAAVVKEVADDGGQAHAVRADQGSLDDLLALPGQAGQLFGPLDILVINAGIAPPEAFGDVTEESYDRVMAVNAKGPFFLIQRAGPKLRDGGRIICISTLSTVLHTPDSPVYPASKAALEQFATVAAMVFGGRGITVNCVSPGSTDTELLRSANPGETFEDTASFIALKRLGQPADIASVVAFLAGPDSQWITGQNLRATGGEWL
ncbi:MAG: SDR family oxidoreductase [Streptosporangiaceae bacterium]|nr:SDR family oxidoreductase [Streptosporangiaceae bacterium]MBV9854367.1 SDR family oxidoreductase [Streptosporangiaceae bacterium]